MQLVPCPACRRHVDAHEITCPFCATTRVAARAPALVRTAGRVSRAAVFAGAAACWTNNPPPQYASSPDNQQQQPQDPPPDQEFGELDGQPPNPKLVKKPRADKGTILGRVVDANSKRYPGVAVTIGGPLQTVVTTDARGLFILENVPPGTYRVTIESARLTPRDPPIAADLTVVAGQVATMAILGQAVGPVAVPVHDNGCCKPYGAPPARRRVV